MKNVLIVTASARSFTGVSHALASAFGDSLIGKGNNVVHTDLSLDPSPALNALFVEAAFTPPVHRTPAQAASLAYSDEEISRLRAADILLIATPMYNFWVPGLLKSWFDQIIRPGETFRSTGDLAKPYEGLLELQQCIVATVRGSEAFAPNGPAAEWNFLDRHLTAMLGLIGIADPTFIDLSGVDENPALTETRKSEIMARLRNMG